MVDFEQVGLTVGCMESTKLHQQLSEIRELLVVSWALEADEADLHYHHPTRKHAALPAPLQKAHQSARDHSDHAIHKTGRNPHDQKALFHKVAAKKSQEASKKLHAAGFHGLGNFHDAAKQHHDAMHARHSAEHARGETGSRQAPREAPPETQQGQQPLPKEVHKAHEKSRAVSHEAHVSHDSEHLTPKQKRSKHNKAFKALVHAAGELKRHGRDSAEAEREAHRHLAAMSSLR